MTLERLIRLAGAATILVAALLLAVDVAPSVGTETALVAACGALVALAGTGRLRLARDRRRIRVAMRQARRAEQAVSGRQTLSGTALVLAGVVFALLAVQRALGISFWALVLLAAGGALVWAQTVDLPDGEDAEPTGWQRLLGRRPRGQDGDRLLLLAGVGLVVLGALVALSSLGALGASRTSVLQTVVALAAVLVVAAPFWRRMLRRAQAERSERIRSDERAEVAAHLHDSVLQTLALIQRRADDPRAVASLARRQERELRTWLSGRSERPDDELMAALRAAAAAVEVEHRVEIEVVTSGERPLDDRTAALVAAAREAMANAARHACPAPADDDPVAAGGDVVAISVFAEAEPGRVEVFVRDRGRGFDPDAIPGDRRGVRESIVGRMRRAGGRATIHSAPGEGTEVELLLEDRS
ncbi:ATP-binding protein [Patulibacter sp. SYSU D01012]|uniref:sensor histidine kinase n=1 Tax=Patulibacter sp. SYSU D01012 TaxID=2817381 RepID=UPI001B301709